MSREDHSEAKIHKPQKRRDTQLPFAHVSRRGNAAQSGRHAAKRRVAAAANSPIRLRGNVVDFSLLKKHLHPQISRNKLQAIFVQKAGLSAWN
jgi:hypothetical protein